MRAVLFQFLNRAPQLFLDLFGHLSLVLKVFQRLRGFCILVVGLTDLPLVETSLLLKLSAQGLDCPVALLCFLGVGGWGGGGVREHTHTHGQSYVCKAFKRTKVKQQIKVVQGAILQQLDSVYGCRRKLCCYITPYFEALIFVYTVQCIQYN